VDALSNILENLGMPQGADQNGGAASAAASAAAATNGGGTKKLTLADLQSAMGGVSNLQENPPGLHEVVSPSAISGLLENEEVRNRLLQELPEEQRSAEFLESCLRSPQVQQVRLLTTCCL
jgi:hypothetical protein